MAKVAVRRSIISPSDIAGLTFWLDATDSTTLFQDDALTTPAGAGEVVGGWQDKSANGYHLTQSSAASKPVLQASAINGHAGVQFDGSDDVLFRVGAALTNEPMTVFAVAVSSTTVKNQTLFCLGANAAAGHWAAMLSDSSAQIWAQKQAPDGFSATAQQPSYTANVPLVVEAAFVDDDYCRVAKNGNPWWGNAVGRSDPTAAFTSVGAIKRSGLAGYLAGSIGEVLVYDSILTWAQRWQVLNYLAARWGLTLQTTLPGAWCWFQNPRAVYTGGQTVLGWAGTASYPGVFIGTAEPGGAVRMRAKVNVGGNDDHNNPGFLVRASDSKVMAFECGHGGGAMYMHISASATDMENWRSTNIHSFIGGSTYSYPNPLQLTGEANAPIYLLYRAIDVVSGRGCHYVISLDDGATWSADRTLLSSGDGITAYFNATRNGTDRIDIAMHNSNPNNSTQNSLYHGYIQGGNLYKSDGTLVGDITAGPYAPTALTEVYNYTTSGSSWIWSIVIDSNGYPVLAYAAFPNSGDHRYRYARWNGSAWVDHEICASGGRFCVSAEEPHYSGGICLDPTDPNVAYLSAEVDEVHEMFHYVTADGGATWTPTQLTSGSTYVNVRPIVPLNRHASSPMFYFAGPYTHWNAEYETEIKAYRP